MGKMTVDKGIWRISVGKVWTYPSVLALFLGAESWTPHQLEQCSFDKIMNSQGLWNHLCTEKSFKMFAIVSRQYGPLRKHFANLGEWNELSALYANKEWEAARQAVISYFLHYFPELRKGSSVAAQIDILPEQIATLGLSPNNGNKEHWVCSCQVKNKAISAWCRICGRKKPSADLLASEMIKRQRNAGMVVINPQFTQLRVRATERIDPKDISKLVSPNDLNAELLREQEIAGSKGVLECFYCDGKGVVQLEEEESEAGIHDRGSESSQLDEAEQTEQLILAIRERKKARVRDYVIELWLFLCCIVVMLHYYWCTRKP